MHHRCSEQQPGDFFGSDRASKTKLKKRSPITYLSRLVTNHSSTYAIAIWSAVAELPVWLLV